MADWDSITLIIHQSLFYQLAAILILSGVLGFLALKLRQPLIIAFIVAGLLAGSDFLDIAPHDSKTIETLAALGIALLLFMVGLKLDLGLIRTLGAVALITGLAQVILTTVIGFILGIALGFDWATSLFVGIALSFSSTIIVVKLLSDKRDIESLYGKISLGILIVQDLVVILSMVAVTALANEPGIAAFNVETFVAVFVKIAVLIAAVALFVRYIADPLTLNLARSPELMVIFAIGLAATMAALCHVMELSKELGGLLAGIALASSPIRAVLSARLSPLRDFLLLFFFVGLGAQLNLSILGGQIVPALFLSAFVLIIKPIIIMMIMGLMGYRKRTGFMAGMTLGQISEFSMIFAAMAFASGQIGAEISNLITLVGIITIGVSVYTIVYSNRLYVFFEDILQIFEQEQPQYEEELPDSNIKKKYDVLIFGMGRYGTSMASEFKKMGASVLGIDFDPGAVHHAQSHGVPAIYGDAADPEFPNSLPLGKAATVVMAFPHHISGPLQTDIRKILAKTLRDIGFKGHIVVTSHKKTDAEDLHNHGVDIVLCPFEDAARQGAGHILELTKGK